MKKKLQIFILVMVALMTQIAGGTLQLQAASNTYVENLMEISLEKDGSAHVVQRMTMDIQEGTENYLVMDNMRDMEIEDFVVTESGKSYRKNTSWDSSASREQKTNTYGIVTTSSGYELCWGVGEYGTHTYEVSYRLTNFMQRFSDKDGFLQRVINDEMSFAPEYVRVTIGSDLAQFTPEETRVWAFGFAGTIFVQNGVIVAETTEPMHSENYMNIMASFPQTIFNPTATTNDSFDHLRDKAFVGSDYDVEGIGGTVDTPASNSFGAGGVIAMLVTIFLGSLTAIIGITHAVDKTGKYYRTKYGKALRRYVGEQSAKGTYYREIPVEANIAAATYLLQHGATAPSDGNVIGSYLLNWVNNGWIEMLEETKIGLFNKEKKTVSIRFIGQPEADQVGLKLHEMLSLLEVAAEYESLYVLLIIFT